MRKSSVSWLLKALSRMRQTGRVAAAPAGAPQWHQRRVTAMEKKRAAAALAVPASLLPRPSLLLPLLRKVAAVVTTRR